MKKIMLIIGITISLFTMPIYAEQSKADVLTWNHESIMNGRERTPVRLPTIYINYDADSKSIAVISSENCEAIIYIYDINGNLIDSADSMDEILSVAGSDSSIFFVRIESNKWYATSTIGD